MPVKKGSEKIPCLVWLIYVHRFFKHTLDAEWHGEYIENKISLGFVIFNAF